MNVDAYLRAHMIFMKSFAIVCYYYLLFFLNRVGICFNLGGGV